MAATPVERARTAVGALRETAARRLGPSLERVDAALERRPRARAGVIYGGVAALHLLALGALLALAPERLSPPPGFVPVEFAPPPTTVISDAVEAGRDAEASDAPDEAAEDDAAAAAAETAAPTESPEDWTPFDLAGALEEAADRAVEAAAEAPGAICRRVKEGGLAAIRCPIRVVEGWAKPGSDWRRYKDAPPVWKPEFARDAEARRDRAAYARLRSGSVGIDQVAFNNDARERFGLDPSPIARPLPAPTWVLGDGIELTDEEMEMLRALAEDG